LSNLCENRSCGCSLPGRFSIRRGPSIAAKCLPLSDEAAGASAGMDAGGANSRHFVLKQLSPVGGHPSQERIPLFGFADIVFNAASAHSSRQK